MDVCWSLCADATEMLSSNRYSVNYDEALSSQCWERCLWRRSENLFDISICTTRIIGQNV